MRKKMIIGLTLAAVLGASGMFAVGLTSATKILPKPSHQQEIETAKDEGYKQGYEDCILSIFDDESIAIMQELYGSGLVYSGVLSNGNTILSKSSQQGLFLLSRGKYSKIYDKGTNWKVCIEDLSGAYLSCSADIGIFYLSYATSEITNVYEGGKYWEGNLLNDGNIIFTSTSVKGALFYDTKTKMFSMMQNTEIDTFRKAIQLRDGNIILASTNKLCLYNPQSQEIEQTLSSSSVGWGTYDITVFTNGNALFYTTYSGGTTSNGIVSYNSETKQFEKLYEEGYCWYPVKQIDEDKVLISSTKDGQGKSSGILLYDSVANSFEKIYDSGWNWNKCMELKDDKILFGSTSSYSTGVLLFDKADCSISLIYVTENAWDVFEGDEAGVDISSSKNPSQGRLRYDFATGQVTKIVEE